MAADVTGWQELARGKLDSINDSIPEKWRVKSLPSCEQQRNVTGDFIRQYLNTEEAEITESTATTIVKKTSAGQWTAETVARAFCHRASLAHQLVIGSLVHKIFLYSSDWTF